MIRPADGFTGSEMLSLGSLQLQLGVRFGVKGLPVLLRIGESTSDNQQDIEARHVGVHL